MAKCDGRIPLSAKVDQRTHEMIEEEANKIGIYQSELIRRLIDTYAEAREDELDCPHCGGELRIDLGR